MAACVCLANGGRACGGFCGPPHVAGLDTAWPGSICRVDEARFFVRQDVYMHGRPVSPQPHERRAVSGSRPTLQVGVNSTPPPPWAPTCAPAAHAVPRTPDRTPHKARGTGYNGTSPTSPLIEAHRSLGRAFSPGLKTPGRTNSERRAPPTPFGPRTPRGYRTAISPRVLWPEERVSSIAAKNDLHSATDLAFVRRDISKQDFMQYDEQQQLPSVGEIRAQIEAMCEELKQRERIGQREIPDRRGVATRQAHSASPFLGSKSCTAPSRWRWPDQKSSASGLGVDLIPSPPPAQMDSLPTTLLAPALLLGPPRKIAAAAEAKGFGHSSETSALEREASSSIVPLSSMQRSIPTPRVQQSRPHAVFPIGDIGGGNSCSKHRLATVPTPPRMPDVHCNEYVAPGEGSTPHSFPPPTVLLVAPPPEASAANVTTTEAPLLQHMHASASQGPGPGTAPGCRSRRPPSRPPTARGPLSPTITSGAPPSSWGAVPLIPEQSGTREAAPEHAGVATLSHAPDDFPAPLDRDIAVTEARLKALCRRVQAVVDGSRNASGDPTPDGKRESTPSPSPSPDVQEDTCSSSSASPDPNNPHKLQIPHEHERQCRRSRGLVFNPGSATVECVHISKGERRFSYEVTQGAQVLTLLSVASEAQETTVYSGSRPGSLVLPAMATEERCRESSGELFSRFIAAGTVSEACETFNALLHKCSTLAALEPVELPYRRFRRLDGLSWRAKSVWKLLDARADLPEYAAAPLAGKRALVCGAGPCGLRTALELALLGADVTVLEKRPIHEAFSRINRLHLWEWCKQDLLGWGAKVFDPPGGTFGGDNDFCHIGIGELQLLLAKSALLLGIELRFGTEAVGVDSGSLVCRDRVRLPCEILMLADGANSPLSRALGLKAVVAEIRGKGSAIGVVANFVNSRDPQQMVLRQFSWARQFNQPLFASLEEQTGVNLENVVYYKAQAHHYIVMTPTRKSLLENEVLRDGTLNGRLLHGSNVNITQLSAMVKRVAAFFGLPTDLCESQGAMIFDFSGVKRLESATTVADGIFACAVGDALLEPFWPEGLGIIRGFMSALDAASAAVVAASGDVEGAADQMASTYNVLKSVAAQTAGQCLQKDMRQYRLTPSSRYTLGSSK